MLTQKRAKAADSDVKPFHGKFYRSSISEKKNGVNSSLLSHLVVNFVIFGIPSLAPACSLPVPTKFRGGIFADAYYGTRPAAHCCA